MLKHQLTALLLTAGFSVSNLVAQDAKPTVPGTTAPAKPARPAKPKPTGSATVAEVHGGTEKRFQSFTEISKKGEAQLVFLGDSITQGWEGAGKAAWEKNYAPLKAANFGIGGDRTEHVLYRFDQGNLDGLKPKLVVVMIGTNNTGHRQDPAADTAAGVKAILAGIAKKCPESKVLLLGIFPRGANPDDKLRVLNGQINDIIKTYADGKKVFYKDIGSKFLAADGTLSKDIMPDLLHLNAKGYDLWVEGIQDEVKTLMK